MSADLDHVIAGVRVRRGKPGDDDLIDDRRARSSRIRIGRRGQTSQRPAARQRDRGAERRTARPRSAAPRCPDSRTTPMPPRPGGVAMATMVSASRTARVTVAVAARSTSVRDHDGLEERVADALGRHRGVFGDGQVHESSRVGVERADFLRRAGLRALSMSACRLPQLGVLISAEAQRVDHVVPIAARVAAEGGVDDHLQRVQRFALRRSRASAPSPARFTRTLSGVSSEVGPQRSPIAVTTRRTKSMTWASRSYSWTVPCPGFRYALGIEARARLAARAGRANHPIRQVLLANRQMLLMSQ